MSGSLFGDDPRDEPVDDLDEVGEIIAFSYSITSYGADYPVDSLVKRMETGDIVVPRFNWDPAGPSEIVGFQREYVWPRPKADRFIESLLLGLPVPGIFLVKEQSGRLLVLDGHQRLYTLSAFYQGTIGPEVYKLHGVQDRFDGKRYKDLDMEDRRRLDDSIIHATVVRQDDPSEDQSSIYMIFERLNTGGLNLQPQEIRVALFHGELVGVLRRLNEHPAWRELYGRTSSRLKDLEMILRFFALFYHASSYSSPMKTFLNRYMAANRHLAKQPEAQLTDLFKRTTDMALAVLGPRAFKPKKTLNAAVIDSLMTGLARRLEAGPISDNTMLAARYNELIKDERYLKSVETGTSQEGNLRTRLERATAAFADVR